MPTEAGTYSRVNDGDVRETVVEVTGSPCGPLVYWTPGRERPENVTDDGRWLGPVMSHEEGVALRAERDRLRRVLACERGDEAAAPEGWKWWAEHREWRKGDARSRSRVWSAPEEGNPDAAYWSHESLELAEWIEDDGGAHPWMLDAMDASDAADARSQEAANAPR